MAVSSARSAVIAPSRRDEEEAVASSDPVRMAPRKAAPLDSIRRVSGADTGPSKRDEEVATMSSVPSLLTGALKREPLDSVICPPPVCTEPSKAEELVSRISPVPEQCRSVRIREPELAATVPVPVRTVPAKRLDPESVSCRSEASTSASIELPEEARSTAECLPTGALQTICADAVARSVSSRFEAGTPAETEQLLTDWASIEMRRSPSRPSTVTWSITLSSAVTRMSDAAGSTVTRIPRETCREW